MKNIKKIILVGILATLQFVTINAQSDVKKGIKIATESEERDKGFKDSQVEMEMILRNKNGDESTRYIRNKTLEVVGDGDKSLVIFNKPRDVKGTAFLSFTHKSGPDDQWLYLPALKRVKRIASNNKSGPFMGSEFSYEDIASQEIEKYTYRYIGEETLAGKNTLKIERYPTDKKSGYTKQVVWYDAEKLIPLKVDFYDRKSVLLKSLTYEGYNQYKGKFWRADKMMMVNHQSGKSTELIFKKYKFMNGFTSRDFDKTSLKRIR